MVDSPAEATGFETLAEAQKASQQSRQALRLRPDRQRQRAMSGVRNSAMIRIVGAVVGIVAGLAVQVWLANVSIFWLWLAGFFPGEHPHAMRNAFLCLAPCVLILMAQGMLLWFAIVGAMLRRRHVRADARCLHRGYDLTGNVSGRCPECGVTVGAAARSAPAHGEQR